MTTCGDSVLKDPFNKNYPGKYYYDDGKFDFANACDEEVGTLDFERINKLLNDQYSFDHLLDIATSFGKHYDDCCPFTDAGPDNDAYPFWNNFNNLANDKTFVYACRGVICGDEQDSLHNQINFGTLQTGQMSPDGCLQSCNETESCVGVSWDEPTCTVEDGVRGCDENNGICFHYNNFDDRKISFEPSTSHIFFKKEHSLLQAERSTNDLGKGNLLTTPVSSNNNSRIPIHGDRGALFYKSCSNQYAQWNDDDSGPDVNEVNVCYSYPQVYEQLV